MPHPPHSPTPTPTSNLSTSNINHSSAARSTQSSNPRPSHQQNRNQAWTGTANIDNSAAYLARLPGQSQTLGRRQRSPASDGPLDPQTDSSQAPGDDLGEPPT